jgi:membrane-associated phospholipid phosphatase
MNTWLTLLLVAQLSYGQSLESKKDKDTTSIWQLMKHDATYTAKGVGYSLSRPIYWKAKDFTKMGTLIAGTALLSLADDPVRDFASNGREHVPEILRDFGWYFGSPQNYFMANAGLYGFGLLTKNEQVRKTSVLIITSSITSGLIQSFTKTAIGRARPGTELGNHSFSPFSKEGRFHSFPSGHTILSVTMAHSIAKQFDNIWIKTGIYAIGAIPPMSRLIDDAHWITDIAFSTALSIIIVDGVDKFLFNEDAYNYPKRPKTISWNITFGSNTIGVVGQF